MKRAQENHIIQDLHKKMVFLVGPRQAGKTYLAKRIARAFKQTTYLNYDSHKDQTIIQQEAWLNDTELLILDELHKMADWKNYLKGVYDTKPEHLKILVTGSARLEVYREIGDSLAGRYFLHHLLPFSPAELHALKQDYTLDQLMNRGGFPEPYLSDSDTDAERWRLQYTESLVRSDILDFKSINNLRAIQQVFELLRRRVGSTLSYQSIAEDVGTSPITIKKYIEIFEALYIVFRVTPFSNNIARSLLKEPKVYFFDTGLVEGDDGARFENLVANSLLKACYVARDIKAKDFKLHYIRTKDKREVDFALCLNNKIEQLVEAKLSQTDIDKNLVHFAQKYELNALQLVKNIKKEYQQEGIRCLDAKHYLENLDL